MAEITQSQIVETLRHLGYEVMYREEAERLRKFDGSEACRCEACTTILPKRNAELARERAENDRMRLTIGRLSAEVSQWSCVKCRFVYPGPPQPGLECVVCPRCGGDTMPRNAAELRVLRAENEQQQKKIEQLGGEVARLSLELGRARTALMTIWQAAINAHGGTGHDVDAYYAEPELGQ